MRFFQTILEKSAAGLRMFVTAGLILPAFVIFLFPGASLSADTPLREVRLQLKWRHQFQFAGYYAAASEGYFREAGLHVTFLENEPGKASCDSLLNGKAEFAVDGPSVLIRRVQGQPLVALAAVFQHSPAVMMALRGSGISSPQDLAGRRVMYEPATDAEFSAMLMAEGVRQGLVTSVPHSWDIEDLVSGRVDAMSAYIGNEPNRLRVLGFDPVLIRPVSYGIDFYGDCLFAAEDLVHERPEMVDAFLDAAARGWEFAMNNPRETAMLIRARYAPDISLDQLLAEAEAIRALINSDYVGIGHMNPARWRHIAQVYASQGMIPDSFDLSGFVYSEIREQAEERRSRSTRITVLVLLGTVAVVGAAGAILFAFNARLGRQVRERTRALAASERIFRTFFEVASIGVAQMDGTSRRILKANGKFCDLTGYSASELQDLTTVELTHPDDLSMSEAVYRDLLENRRREATLEKRYVRRDGSVFWGAATISPLWTDDALPEFYLVLLRDVSVRKGAEEELLLANKVFENTIEGIVVTDPEGTIVQVNPGFTAITGYEAGEAVGENPRLLKSDRHPQHFYRDMWERLVSDGHWAGEIWNRRKNGESYPEWLTISAVRDARGKTTNYVSIFHDITELKRQQDALEYQAQHDALTGLPNRVLLDDRLRMALAQLERSQGRLALLFLDLDNFKTINDGLGHDAGDALLMELSGRLTKLLRTGDTLARLGGDEFLILLPEIEDINDAGHIAARMLDAMADPFRLGDDEHFVTASIGVTIAPDDGCEAGKLIKNADMAMYRAKSMGRNNYQFFTREMDLEAHRRISLESRLRRALDAGEFELHYQPLVNMISGEIFGAEALVRWRSEGTLIPPGEFIPLAEDCGLILPLGDWVLRTAARQARLWQDAGHDLNMSVNISSRQFAGSGLVSTLREVLQETELAPGRLYFEITESMLMGDMSKAEATLTTLRRAGGTFFLDDFGTGYSSLSYLKRLPLDGIKIDRSFIRDISEDQDSLAIVAAIVSMARTLNLRIVAEGVETEDQRRLLASMGKMILQGYLASPPLPAARFEEFLQRPTLLSPLEDPPGGE
jgi:diguanylate cyclase (GGDEF)-like protein/PAS domain S-box-containing protein